MGAGTTRTERQTWLRRLVDDGAVKMTWAEEVMERPAPFAGRKIAAGRVRGMLLGLAVGDALGGTSEGMLAGERREHFGEIRNYLPNRHAEQQEIGLPSDDTQLAFLTVAHLLEHERIEPDALAEQFCSHRIFGIGRSTRAFVASWNKTRDWRKAAQPSAGNGGLMRIAPVLLPHLRGGSADLWVDTALATAISHNDRSAIASSIAFVGLLGELLAMPTPPQVDWWVETFLARAKPIEGDETLYRPRSGPLADASRGPLWQFVAEHVPPALEKPVQQAQETWHSGAYLMETVPTVLHVLARHGSDPEEAIVRAVNDTKDNDTVAAIVGAAVGALHGDEALPERWRRGHSGRVIADRDEPNLFNLIDDAVARFVDQRGP